MPPCWPPCWSGVYATHAGGVELAEQARLANDALAEQAGEGQFVTGLLVRIDLTGAAAGIVNAGHPPPLRLRAGQVEHVPLKADRPFGLQPDAATGCKRCSWRWATG